jgi:hypothetical protein
MKGYFTTLPITMSFRSRTIRERNLSLKMFLLKRYFTSPFFDGKVKKGIVQYENLIPTKSPCLAKPKKGIFPRC